MPKILLRCTAAVVLFPVSPTIASAEASTAAESSAPLEEAAGVTKENDKEIVITGARTRLPATALPLTYDVLGGKDFTQQVAVSGSVIDAVSARLPAFSPAREKLSGAGETLRGRSPLFAINGVPQSTPIRDGARDGYTIDPFFIDRVEVIYGSNALQGIGATGGVVNQVTVGAPAAGFAIRAMTQGTAQSGFGNDAGGKIAGLAGWRGGAFDLTGGLSFEKRGAFVDGHGNRIGVDGTQGEIQDSDSWSLFGRAGWQVGETARIELVANRFELEGNGHYVVVPGNRETGVPATSRRGETPGETTSNRAELLSLAFSETDLWGGAFNAQAFFSRTRDIFGGGTFANFQDPTIAAPGILFDQSVNNSRKLGGKLGYERSVPGFEDLTLIGGVDMLNDRTAQNLLLTGRSWVPESTFQSVAPFLQGNLKLLDGKLRLAGGTRHENVRLKVGDFHTLAATTFVACTPTTPPATPCGESTYGGVAVAGGKPTFEKLLFNGGLVVEPVRGLRAYASYAEGYTIPDVGRILRGIKEEGVDVDNFLDLQPVVSNNREIGVEWKRGRLTASASYWWSDSKLGSILVENADGIYDVIRRPVSLQGLDVALDWQTPLEGLSLGTAYARTRGRTDTDDNGSMDADLDGANISPDRLNVHAAYERGSFDARLAIRTYFERSFDGQPEVNDFNGYTLFDAAVGYRMGKQRVSLSALNLTDEYYITYHSDTQEPTSPSARLKDAQFFAGRGRTITLGVTSSF